MKKFLQATKGEIRLNSASYWQLPLCVAGGWFFGFLILCAVFLFANETTYAPIGGLLALMVGFMLCLVLPAYYYSTGMDIAMGMGRTRRMYIASCFAATFIQLLFIAGCSVVLCVLDLAVIQPVFFRSFPLDEDFIQLLQFLPPMAGKIVLYMVGGALGLCVFGIIAGAMIKRWGKGAMWFFWALWMGFFLLGSRIAEVVRRGTANNILDSAVLAVADFIAQIPAGYFIGGGAVLLVAATLLAVRSLCRTTVKAI